MPNDTQDDYTTTTHRHTETSRTVSVKKSWLAARNTLIRGSVVRISVRISKRDSKRTKQAMNHLDTNLDLGKT